MVLKTKENKSIFTGNISKDVLNTKISSALLYDKYGKEEVYEELNNYFKEKYEKQLIEIVEKKYKKIKIEENNWIKAWFYNITYGGKCNLSATRYVNNNKEYNVVATVVIYRNNYYVNNNIVVHFLVEKDGIYYNKAGEIFTDDIYEVKKFKTEKEFIADDESKQMIKNVKLELLSLLNSDELNKLLDKFEYLYNVI